jgi:hypothetical protein
VDVLTDGEPGGERTAPSLVVAESLSGDHPIPDSLFRCFAVSLFRQRQAASNITTQVCDDNGTLIVIMAKYAVELRAG